jgi:hypothetical protein
MYEKEIRELTGMRFWPSMASAHCDALTAAIELMRAAEPRDAEAEREYCQVLANTIDGRSDTMRFIRGQRAAARAEGYAQGHKTLAAEAGVDQLEADLAAAQAEIERLRTQFEIQEADLQNALAAMRAAHSARGRALDTIDAIEELIEASRA